MSRRMTYTVRGSRREYIVRIYFYPEQNRYAVIAFHGGLYGDGRPRGSRRMQFKNHYRDFGTAQNQANNVYSGKRRAHRGEALQEQDNYIRPDLPGTLRSQPSSVTQREEVEQEVEPTYTPEERVRRELNQFLNNARETLDREEELAFGRFVYKIGVDNRGDTVGTVIAPELHIPLDIKASSNRDVVIQWLLGKLEEEYRAEAEGDSEEYNPLQDPDVSLVDIITDPKYKEHADQYVPTLIDRINDLDVQMESGKYDYPEIQELVHALLNSPYRDKALELPKRIFDSIRMTDEDRAIIEEHFKPKPVIIEEEEEEDIPEFEMPSSLFAKNKGWYKSASHVKKNLKGYFRTAIENNGEMVLHNVWWEGYGPNVKISDHDIPSDLFKDRFSRIRALAHQESEKLYKRVIGIK